LRRPRLLSPGLLRGRAAFDGSTCACPHPLSIDRPIRLCTRARACTPGPADRFQSRL